MSDGSKDALAMSTLTMDAMALAEGFRSGVVDPVEALTRCLARIESLDPALNCFVALSPRAREDAEASARRMASGKALGPLDGVPVAVKDNLAVAGMPATWGSRLFADTVCERDELPIARLRAQGAVFIGKTNTPEFAVEGNTGNALFGVTGNAWQPQLTPGGSSGGSVSAVGAGMVPVALGTDGGGSIRRPAAYLGLVGLKPSIGRIARYGGLPQVLLDFEVVGPLTRSVRDARALLAAMSGPDPRDQSSWLPAAASGDGQGEGKSLRILLVETLGGAPCDPRILASVRRAAEWLGKLGHRIECGALPLDIAPLNANWPKIGAIGLARLMSERADFRAKASAKYVAMAEQGALVDVTTLASVLDQVWQLRARAGEVFEGLDLVMTPACAAMPWAADVTHPEQIDGQAVGPRGHAIYTGWVNAIGHPAITLPGEPADNGMPIGFQLIGGFGREEMLLGIAEQYEAAYPWSYPFAQADASIPPTSA